MRGRRLMCLAVAACGLAWPSQGEAQEQHKPFEFALYSPIQVRAETDAIQVFRLSLLYGKNRSVRGLDVGLVAHSTGGVSKGLQYAVVGIVEGDFLGWQNDVVSITRGEFTGLQTGVFTERGSGEAVQFGAVNRAHSGSGFQLGLINYADDFYGVQIGLINIISSKDAFGVLPIVNWRF